MRLGNVEKDILFYTSQVDYAKTDECPPKGILDFLLVRKNMGGSTPCVRVLEILRTRNNIVTPAKYMAFMGGTGLLLTRILYYFFPSGRALSVLWQRWG